MSGADINLVDLRKAVERANDRLGGVSIERMGGDNLAVTLCTHFDDAEGEQDENGWTEAATAGCDETIRAIRDHYAPLFEEFFDLLDAKEARIAELEAERTEAVASAWDAAARKAHSRIYPKNERADWTDIASHNAYMANEVRFELFGEATDIRERAARLALSAQDSGK